MPDALRYLFGGEGAVHHQEAAELHLDQGQVMGCLDGPRCCRIQGELPGIGRMVPVDKLAHRP